LKGGGAMDVIGVDKLREISKRFGLEPHEIASKLLEYMDQAMDIFATYKDRLKTFDELQKWLNTGEKNERELKLYALTIIVDICGFIALRTYEKYLFEREIEEVMIKYNMHLAVMLNAVRKKGNKDKTFAEVW